MTSNYFTGIATITARGINFLDMYYSCSMAISKKWYEQAQLHGESQITILYDATDLTKIWIRVVNVEDELDEIEVANVVIREEISNSKLEKYFESIQKLKSLRNKKRKVRTDE